MVSCSKEHGNDDLQKYVSDLSKKPVPAIENLPEFKPYEQYIYDAYDQRSPFAINKPELTTEDSQKPQQNLELYPLASLVMVGTISDRATIWALIQVPSGQIYQATVGQSIGNSSGRIVAIDKSAIHLKEKVFDNDQKTWVEQETELPLRAGGIAAGKAKK